jgi:hypothetical protein
VSQEILVPGSYWDGAWTWTSTDNAAVVGTGVQDAAHNFAFEVHQYLDADGSGTHPGAVSATIGVERLTAITQWSEATGNHLFLGEVGVTTDQTSLTALDGMLTYMQQHTDAWQGATYWAGGPWWGNYMFSIEPQNGVDKPQMAILVQHLTLATGPNPPPPAGTSADMVLHRGDGTYGIYDIGNNRILGSYQLGLVGTDWQFVGLGGFYGADTADMLLRNATTGGFEVYDISNNNITNAAFLGNVGMDWQVMGFGNFSSRGESDMILRNSNTGGVEVYDISSNQITGAAFMGHGRLELAVLGRWQFQRPWRKRHAPAQLQYRRIGGLRHRQQPDHQCRLHRHGGPGLAILGRRQFQQHSRRNRSLAAQRQYRRVGSIRHQQQPNYRRRLLGHGRAGLAIRGRRVDPWTWHDRPGIAQRQHGPIRSLRYRQQSDHGSRPLGRSAWIGNLGVSQSNKPPNSAKRWRVSAVAAAQPSR